MRPSSWCRPYSGLIVLVAIQLSGCSDGVAPVIDDQPTTDTTLVLQVGTSAALDWYGDTAELKAFLIRGWPDPGYKVVTDNYPVRWSSEDTTVVGVSPNGVAEVRSWEPDSTVVWGVADDFADSLLVRTYGWKKDHGSSYRLAALAVGLIRRWEVVDSSTHLHIACDRENLTVDVDAWGLPSGMSIAYGMGGPPRVSDHWDMMGGSWRHPGPPHAFLRELALYRDFTFRGTADRRVETLEFVVAGLNHLLPPLLEDCPP